MANLTYDKYLEIVQNYNYENSKEIRKNLDDQMSKMSVKEFCDEQLKTFDYGDKTGYEININAYLLSKFDNTLLATCTTEDGFVHYVTIMLDQNDGCIKLLDPVVDALNPKLISKTPLNVKEYEYARAGLPTKEYKILTSLSPLQTNQTMADAINNPKTSVVVDDLDKLTKADGIQIKYCTINKYRGMMPL